MTLLQDMLQRRLARLEDINRTSVRLTAGLAAFHCKMIFRNANARLPSDAQLPEADLEHFANLLMDGISGDSKSTERDSGGD